MSKNHSADKLWGIVFVFTFILIIIYYFDFFDIKVQFDLDKYVYYPAILINSLSIYKLLKPKKINIIIVISASLLIPIYLIAYPRISARYDFYCAEHTPGNFYYNPQKGKSLIPCMDRY